MVVGEAFGMRLQYNSGSGSAHTGSTPSVAWELMGQETGLHVPYLCHSLQLRALASGEMIVCLFSISSFPGKLL